MLGVHKKSIFFHYTVTLVLLCHLVRPGCRSAHDMLDMFWILKTILWHSHFPVEDSFQKSCVRTVSDWRGWMYVHVFALHCVASVPCYILWLEGLAEHHLPRAAERRVSQSLGCTDGGVHSLSVCLLVCLNIWHHSPGRWVPGDCHWLLWHRWWCACLCICLCLCFLFGTVRRQNHCNAIWF